MPPSSLPQAAKTVAKTDKNKVVSIYFTFITFIPNRIRLSIGCKALVTVKPVQLLHFRIGQFKIEDVVIFGDVCRIR